LGASSSSAAAWPTFRRIAMPTSTALRTQIAIGDLVTNLLNLLHQPPATSLPAACRLL
jgi:hypothetical protein